MNDVGNKGEKMVRDFFEWMEYDVVPAPDRKFYDYDMTCIGNDAVFTIEVKTDVSAYTHATRRGEADNPRLFVEYYNETNDEPSGIAASCADYYFYLMLKPTNDVECNVFERQELHEYLLHSDVYSHTLVPRFADHQTTGWLPYLGELDGENLIKRQFSLGKWQ